METGRFDLLLERFLSGEATAEEQAELEGMLRADPEKRRILALRSLLEVQLRKAFSGIAAPAKLPKSSETSEVCTSPPRTIPLPPSPWRMGVGIAIAASFLIAVGAGGLLLIAYFSRPSVPDAPIASGQVRIKDAQVPNIPADQPFEVAGDAPAVVKLADGSQATFEPGTKAVLRRPAGGKRQIVELNEGGGSFAVTKAQAQFQVETPVGTVAVVGTEFSVQLSRNAEPGENEPAVFMRVVVRSGSVAVHAGSKSHLLSAGDDRVFPETEKKPPITEIAQGEKKTPQVPPQEKGPQEVDGMLKQVDAAKGSIVVTLREKDDKEHDQRFELSDNVPLFIGEAGAKLGDLKTGIGIHLMLSADGKQVLEIQQEAVAAKLPDPKKDAAAKDKTENHGKGSPNVHGTVKAVDVAKRMITVTRKEKGTVMERTFPVVQGAGIAIGGKAAQLADVRPGMEVHLRLSQSRQSVIDIRIEGKKGKS